jgi:hypothetical protein
MNLKQDLTKRLNDLIAHYQQGIPRAEKTLQILKNTNLTKATYKIEIRPMSTLTLDRAYTEVIHNGSLEEAVYEAKEKAEQADIVIEEALQLNVKLVLGKEEIIIDRGYFEQYI